MCKGVGPPRGLRSDASRGKEAQNSPQEDPKKFSTCHKDKEFSIAAHAQIDEMKQQIATLKEEIKHLQKVKQKGLINLLESVGQRNTHFPAGKRTHIIPIRVTPEEHEFLKKLAARKALSGWIRSLILKELTNPQDTIFPTESSKEA